MLSSLFRRAETKYNKLRRSFGTDVSSPAARRAAVWHFNLFDHAFLRVLWTNLDEIAPNVWRSNQPSPRRIKRYKNMGIRSIISLRGESKFSHHILEEQACEAQGIPLYTAKLAARKLVARERYLELLDLFETVEKPLLFHCKSGADRAGLAGAFYLMHMENVPPKDAAKQLSFKYLHLKNDNTGILDFMLDAYISDYNKDPIPLKQWLQTRYSKRKLTQAYNASKGR